MSQEKMVDKARDYIVCQVANGWETRYKIEPARKAK